jgi:hypothetical protein
MEMGTSHGVVWHSVVQKMADPMTDHYFDESTTHNLKLNENLKLRKSVCQVSMKGDYIVMSRSLHTMTPSLTVILPKTSSSARTSWGGILEES